MEIPKFGPLSGVKVVNASASIAGPFAASLMADWGADVIWVENPKFYEILRMNPLHRQDRRNTRNLALNIPTPEGKEVLFKLIKDADIFIESSKSGQYDKWGLSDEVLWEVNPRLVILHVSGFGQYGDPELLKRPSYDAIGQAFSCYMFCNGFPDRPPVTAFPWTGDFVPPLFGCCSALAALTKARATGEGESIDLSTYEALLRIQGKYPLDWLNYGIPQTDDMRPGDRGMYAGWGCYKCGDGNFLYVCTMGKVCTRKMVEFLGLEYGSEMYPEGADSILTVDPGAPELNRRLEEYLMTKTVEEAEEELVNNGIPCSPIMTYQKATENPHYIARENFIEWEEPNGGKFKGINIVPKFKQHPGQVWRGAPNPGVDNEDILHDAGLSDEEIKDLYDKGIIKKDEEWRFTIYDNLGYKQIT